MALALPRLAGIERARAELAPHLGETPLVRSDLLSRALEADVWLLDETASPIGSFKWRGALCAILRAKDDRAGVVTSSTGNHGLGVAYAARALGCPAHVFLPEGASPQKRGIIEALLATIHVTGRDIDEAKAAARRFAEDRRFLFVDDGESLDLMEGAGTVGLELAGRLPEIDSVFVPMGSGTLAVGCAVALKGSQPRARVVAVQSQGAPAMVESFHARRAIERPIDTIADGLVCRIPAERALAGLLACVDDALAVPDAALLAAMRSLIECAGVLVEPSGAAGLAGAWARRSQLRGRRIVLVLTGANVALPVLVRALGAPPLMDVEARASAAGSDVLLLGHPLLRVPARPVGDVRDPAFREKGAWLVAALAQFRARHGFGRAIAAPQIGVSKRFIALDLGQGPFLVIDPVVTWRSEETFLVWDDCMSFPWLLVRLVRHRAISLSYQDAAGEQRSWERLDESSAELLQHELDHLDGVLALDRALDPASIVHRHVFEALRSHFAAQVDYVIPPLVKAATS